MKIIEGLKQLKELARKADDIKTKILTHCADLDNAEPVYGTGHADQIKQWFQSHKDLVAQILKLRLRIQRTNLDTPVAIEINGEMVTKSIAEWIHRRKDLAKMELSLWSSLGDRGLKPGAVHDPANPGAAKAVNIRRYYDPKTRDVKVEEFTSEPALIDAALEIKNAVTDLAE
jgi:hypothetical protein